MKWSMTPSSPTASALASTRRIACTARPATSPTRIRSSPGYRRKAAADRITTGCEPGKSFNHRGHREALRFPMKRLIRLLLVLFAVSALGQQPQLSPQEALNQYRASKAATLRDDFGELGRYRDANAALKPPAAGEKRVVFFGDSITDLWKLDESFPGKPYVNRGIGGQTTPQMLLRFRQDVVNLQPKVVVILAGTNDIAGNTGPERIEDIEANYA